MAITLNGTTGITTPDVNSDGLTVDTTTLVVDEANNRVGIGTSTPSYRFHLVQPSSDNALVIDNGGGAGDNTNPYLAFSGTSTGSNYIRGRIRGTLPNSTDGGLAFDTGSSGSMSERARIDSSGNLLVGTTSNSGAISNPGVYLRPTSDSTFTSAGTPMQVARTTSNGRAIGFFRNSTVVGEITVTTSSTSYVTSSDYRLKENVVGVTGASARVQQLNPVRFNFIADPDTTVDGFLAHEVQDAVPEAITGTNDATETVDVHDEDGNVTGQEERPVYQGIDQSKLVPLLTAALQESLGKIETLEARVAALEAA